MSRRWLLNENFPAPAAKALRERGWDVLMVAERCAGADDQSVMELATREGRALATFDRDYGELVFQRGLPAPQLVLLLRVGTYQPVDPASWIERLEAAGELHEGYFHIFDGEGVRRRVMKAAIAH